MKDCLFCNIVKRGVNGGVIFENKYCIAFPPLYPITKGHILIATKKHFQDIFDIDKDILAELIKSAKTVIDDVISHTDATGVNLLHASGKDAHQSVFHFHLHVIPRHFDDGLDIITDIFSLSK